VYTPTLSGNRALNNFLFQSFRKPWCPNSLPRQEFGIFVVQVV
jgi:hypothetical protein